MSIAGTLKAGSCSYSWHKTLLFTCYSESRMQIPRARIHGSVSVFVIYQHPAKKEFSTPFCVVGWLVGLEARQLLRLFACVYYTR
jgi:hypothetical protein